MGDGVGRQHVLREESGAGLWRECWLREGINVRSNLGVRRPLNVLRYSFTLLKISRPSRKVPHYEDQ